MDAEQAREVDEVRAADQRKHGERNDEEREPGALRARVEQRLVVPIVRVEVADSHSRSMSRVPKSPYGRTIRITSTTR